MNKIKNWLINKYNYVLQNKTKCIYSNSPLVFKEKQISLEDISHAIQNFFHADTDKKYINANLGHTFRYFIALKYIIEHGLYAGKIFESGGAGVFSHILKTLLGDIDLYSYNGDLRKPIIIDKNNFDVVLCMEVIEHITDECNYHEMRFEGVKTCLQSFFQIMKPNGRLFITTPNISSCISLHHLLYAAHPMIYPIHVREYTPTEIKKISESIGFDTKVLTTENVFSEITVYEQMIQLLHHNGYSLENRGDDIIAIFIKPDNNNMKNSDLMKEFLS
jgi:predicted SAM-dependent methyltransferase